MREGDDDAPPPGEGLENGELLQYLLDHTLLTNLQREVINMVYYRGMTITEVARTLSKNPGTIHRHHERALDKLARCAAQLEKE